MILGWSLSESISELASQSTKSLNITGYMVALTKNLHCPWMKRELEDASFLKPGLPWHGVAHPCGLCCCAGQGRNRGTAEPWSIVCVPLATRPGGKSEGKNLRLLWGSGEDERWSLSTRELQPRPTAKAEWGLINLLEKRENLSPFPESDLTSMGTPQPWDSISMQRILAMAQ